MIGSIFGTVIHQNDNSIIIETPSGIGYKIFTGGQEFTAGGEFRLFTYHHVREDADDLYGFTEPRQLAMFELLLTVSGVGPKMAQNIMTNLGQAAIIDAISSNQPAIFKSVSGVGQKVAEKIIVELKNKLGNFESAGLSGQENGDLFEALVGLGYRQPEITAVMKEIDQTQSMGERLKQALRLLTK